MGVRPVNFNGASLYRPGYYSKLNIEKGGAFGGTPLNKALVIGESQGGIPYNADVLDEGKIMVFAGESEAREALIGGDALEAILFAFNASGDARITGGANRVDYIRVNPALQSSLDLNNIDSAVALNLKSVGYGIYTNGISIEIQNGTVEGKLLFLKLGSFNYAVDNIIRKVVNIQYIGDGDTATLNKTGNTITTSIANQTDGSVNLTLDLTVLDTVQKVVDYFNSQIGYMASVDNPSFSNEKSNLIDSENAIDILVEKTLTQNIQAMVEAINASEIVTATIASEAQRKQLVNLNQTFFTGGSDGVTTNQSWVDALALSENFEYDIVLVLSGDSAVHQLLKSHLTFANSVKTKKERRGLTGASLNDNETTIMNKASLINSQFCGFYGSSDYRFDANGIERKMPGYILAGGLLGMTQANDVTTPLTFKNFNITKLGKNYSNAQIENFIQAGVIISTNAQSGFKIERSVTTYQSANLIANEWSIMGTIIAINKNHRNLLETRFVGLAGDARTVEKVDSYSQEILEDMLAQGWFTEDQSRGVQAITNHRTEVVGDSFKITYDGIVTSPINFLLTNHNFDLLVSV